MYSYNPILPYTSHRAVYWFSTIQKEHMLFAQSAVRACCTLGASTQLMNPKLSRTSGTLLVLPNPTVYHIGIVSGVHKYILTVTICHIHHWRSNHCLRKVLKPHAVLLAASTLTTTLKLCKTSGTLLVLPGQTFYCINMISLGAHRCISSYGHKVTSW